MKSEDAKKDLVVYAALEYVAACDAIPDNIFDISEEERTPFVQRHIIATYALKVAVQTYLGVDNTEEFEYSDDSTS